MLKNEPDTIFYGSERNFDEPTADLGIGRNQCFVRADGFVKVLLALAVLLKDLSPRRGDEDRFVIGKFLGSFLDVVWRRNADQTKIAEDVRDTTVGENGPGEIGRA